MFVCTSMYQGMYVVPSCMCTVHLVLQQSQIHGKSIFILVLVIVTSSSSPSFAARTVHTFRSLSSIGRSIVVGRGSRGERAIFWTGRLLLLSPSFGRGGRVIVLVGPWYSDPKTIDLRWGHVVVGRRGRGRIGGGWIVAPTVGQSTVKKKEQSQENKSC